MSLKLQSIIINVVTRFVGSADHRALNKSGLQNCILLFFPDANVVYGVWASGVCSYWTIYGTQWWASNHTLYLLEKFWVPVMNLCFTVCSKKLQSALKSVQEAWIVQINFSTAFDRVNHPWILYVICSVLFILT